MSIMAVRVVPEGILFATDRNVTVQLPGATATRVGQSRRPKVLKWPNREIIIGFVGVAWLEGQPMDLWLYGFIGRHLDKGEPLGEIAAALKDGPEFAFRSQEAGQVGGLYSTSAVS